MGKAPGNSEAVTSFDQKDARKLTCIELVEEVYPEVKLPVRYVLGRFALMPDDLARDVLERRLRLRFITHYRTDKKGRLVELDAGETEALLTRVRKRPKIGMY